MKTARPRVLLSSTFAPCGVDDMYGRRECVAEVHHNQLTQHQGVYSPRYWWPMMGLHLIAANIGAETTVLDWPTLARFEDEMKKGYDYVGISFIHQTLGKFKKMAERARELSPGSKIIAGGFGATIKSLPRICEVDLVCQGEGIRYMRNLLGESPDFAFQHPPLHCEIVEFLGTPIRQLQTLFIAAGMDRSAIVNNILITGLGCTHNCEFCSTSHFYQCKHLPFLRTGAELYEQMKAKTAATGVNAFFFLGDENFFSDRRRLEQLWKLQRDSPNEYVIRLAFGSFDYISRFDPEMLAELDLDHIWIGLESIQFQFPKTRGRDPARIISDLKRVGIKTILSSILFLDGHTKQNLAEDVDYHLSLQPEHSQFAGLAVIEGTPLFDRYNEEGRVLHEINMEERHAFKQIWHHHPEFSPYESEIFQRRAYERDFHELGPSILRSIMTSARAAPRLLASPSPALRRRGERLRQEGMAGRALCYAAARVAPAPAMRAMIEEWRRELEDLFGKMDRLQRAKAEMIAAFAKARVLRTRLAGDTIQPRFRKTVYP